MSSPFVFLKLSTHGSREFRTPVPGVPNPSSEQIFFVHGTGRKISYLLIRDMCSELGFGTPGLLKKGNRFSCTVSQCLTSGDKLSIPIRDPDVIAGGFTGTADFACFSPQTCARIRA